MEAVFSNIKKDPETLSYSKDKNGKSTRATKPVNEKKLLKAMTVKYNRVNALIFRS